MKVEVIAVNQTMVRSVVSILQSAKWPLMLYWMNSVGEEAWAVSREFYKSSRYMASFLAAMEHETIDLSALGYRAETVERVLGSLRSIYHL